MSDEELMQVALPRFWDERYATAEDKKPTHECFRTFDEYLPFLEPNLPALRDPLTNLKILHLGSGDSVRNFIAWADDTSKFESLAYSTYGRYHGIWQSEDIETNYALTSRKW